MSAKVGRHSLGAILLNSFPLLRQVCGEAQPRTRRYRAIRESGTVGFLRAGTLGVALAACPVIGLGATGRAPEPEWQYHSNYRVMALEVTDGGQTGFSLLPPATTGVNFTNRLAESRHLTNQILLNGAGVAAGDVNADGWCDLFFAGQDSPNELYLNRGGWHFERVTESAGEIGLPDLSCSGTLLVDINGDGSLDLLVNTYGQGTHLFMSHGDGQFTRVSEAEGFNRNRAGMTLAVADVDGDGFLDLYISNYRTRALMDMPNTRFTFRAVDGQKMVHTVNGRPVTDPEFFGRFEVTPGGGIVELGEVDAFYRNRSGAGFTPVPFTEGAFRDADGEVLERPPHGWGLSAMFRDLNGDLLPDLYVCNDFQTEDDVWINRGDGRFQHPPRPWLRHTTWFSMGLDIADFNNDGRNDLFVLDMLSRDHRRRMNMIPPENIDLQNPENPDSRPQYMRNMLFLQRENGEFTEIAALAGVAATEWSWSTLFLDVDLDGRRDLIVANGTERDGRYLDVSDQLAMMRASGKYSDREMFDARALFPRQDTPNLAFRNQGDFTFTETGEAWGLAQPGISQGMAAADLDNDGDLDLVVNNLNTPAALYRNESDRPRLAVRLLGAPPNTRAVGSRVTLHGTPLLQSREVGCGGNYLSCSDNTLMFAVPPASHDLKLEILWRSGRRTTLAPIHPNHLYEILEEKETPAEPLTPASLTPASFTQAHFKDVSHLIPHLAQPPPVPDFELQPTLPRRLSRYGPPVAWTDWNSDDWPDLVVGGDGANPLTVWINESGRAFHPLRPAADAAKPQPATAVLAAPAITEIPTNRPVRLISAASHPKARLDWFPPQSPSAGESRIPEGWAPGPLALADTDADGDLDLFVGGTSPTARYPESGVSGIWLNCAGTYHYAAHASKAFAHCGIVNGAVFTDLDRNGFPDLAVAGEWGPVRVFLNRDGQFHEATASLGLDQVAGLWNGIQAGDFDDDGRMDLVATNRGLNQEYWALRIRPIRLYFADSNRDGIVEIIEAHDDDPLNDWVPMRPLQFLLPGLPYLAPRFSSYEEYGQTSVRDMLGESFPKFQFYEANEYRSLIWLNRGDHFEPRPLPIEAQFAEVFGIAVADFNLDGHEDLFLCQNFFALRPSIPRLDGGSGLCLYGRGDGSFSPVSPHHAGIRIPGEQRSAAVADFNRDGRPDLAVSQNNGPIRLFQNQTAAPGLQILLQGPPKNPDAIGAQIQLRNGNDRSPTAAHEIHAGSGFRSQDSPSILLPRPTPPYEIHVLWPGGNESQFSITTNIPNLTLTFPNSPGP